MCGSYPVSDETNILSRKTRRCPGVFCRLRVLEIPLDRDSALLMTFITPFGRYCFHHLPFGITSAPEHFQKRMSDILTSPEGVVCMTDDVLVHGQTAKEHDEHLLQRLQEAGLTLNRQKCPEQTKMSLFTIAGEVSWSNC